MLAPRGREEGVSAVSLPFSSIYISGGEGIRAKELSQKIIYCVINLFRAQERGSVGERRFTKRQSGGREEDCSSMTFPHSNFAFVS